MSLASTKSKDKGPQKGPQIRNANQYQLQISPNGLPAGPRKIGNGSVASQLPSQAPVTVNRTPIRAPEQTSGEGSLGALDLLFSWVNRLQGWGQQ